MIYGKSPRGRGGGNAPPAAAALRPGIAMAATFYGENGTQMKKTRMAGRLPVWIAGLLCLLTLFGTTAAAAPRAEKTPEEGEIAVTASALFEALFGESEAPLTEAERAALDAMVEVSLRYNRSIPDTTVTTAYDGEAGRLTVQVQSYLYQASNGQAVRWVPDAVTLHYQDGVYTGQLQAPQGEDSYVCQFDGIWNSDDFTLDVEFVWQVEISAGTADELLTLPYAVAQDALEQMQAYEAAKESYDSADSAYRDYLAALAQYEADSEAYAAYLAVKQAYDEKKAAYDAYLAAKAEYDAQVQAYAVYLEKKKAYEEAEAAYYAYEAFRQEYTEVYAAYERYLGELEGALSRLNIMESMFVSDSHGWQFYGGVMGATVDMVLANRDELIKYALVKPSYIDAAYNATQALRPVLRGYAEVRSADYATELERYRAEFAYYTANFEAIRDGVNALNRALRNIYYANSGLQTAMRNDPRTKDKVEHFHQFLGQLYVLSCALNDAETLDPSQTVSKYHSETVAELVEAPLLLADSNHAHPAGVTLPEVEVVLPDNIPEPVEKPVKDFEDMEDPSKTGAPAVVADPGPAPAVVADPGQAPTPVDPPVGEPPVRPDLSDEAVALAGELEDGILPQRQPRGTAQLFAVRETVSCLRSLTNKKTVTFYDWQGNKLGEALVEYGASVTPPDAARPADAQYTYLFLGWVSRDGGETGQTVNLQSVTENLSLSPLYRRVEREYRISWVVNGKTVTQVYHWGDTPVCPVSTDRPADSLEYAFAGWSPAVTPVQGDAVYTAQYTESPRTYTVSWDLGDRVLTSQHTYGEMPECPVTPSRAPDDRVYTFLGWDRALRAVTEDVTYTARYQETVLGVGNDGSACAAEHSDTAVTLVSEQPAVNFAAAAQYAREQGKSLVLRWESLPPRMAAGLLAGAAASGGSWSVTLSPALLDALGDALCTKLEWTQSAGETEEAVLFRLRCLDSAGVEVSFAQALPVTVTYAPSAGMYAMVYHLTNGGERTEAELTRYADGRAELSVTPGAQMLFCPEYQLSFSDPTENCNLTAFPQHMPAGAVVELNANCTYGYEISSAELVYADGTRETVTQSFVMPRGAVSVELKVTRIVYHVSFVVEGTVVSEMDLFFGEEIPLPADPTRPEDDRYTYTFAGWSPYVSVAAGENRSPVYTATFTPVEKQDIAGTDSTRDPFLTVMVPILCAVLVALVVLVVLCVRFRRQIGRALVRVGRWLCVHVSAAAAWVRDRVRRRPDDREE